VEREERERGVERGRCEKMGSGRERGGGGGRERRCQCGFGERTWCWRQEEGRRRRRRRMRRGREITGEHINKRREYGADTRRGEGRRERERIARNEHTGYRGGGAGGS